MVPELVFGRYRQPLTFEERRRKRRKTTIRRGLDLTKVPTVVGRDIPDVGVLPAGDPILIVRSGLFGARSDHGRSSPFP
jgi:hypothetical protein